MKISVFAWNEKYHVKLELSQYEQTFKIKQSDVVGLEGLKELIDQEFLAKAMAQFIQMREAFSETYKRNA
ncbi:MAG: hypothetical protein AAF193_10845, partial [Bacteroidota bacterium]